MQGQSFLSPFDDDKHREELLVEFNDGAAKLGFESPHASERCAPNRGGIPFMREKTGENSTICNRLRMKQTIYGTATITNTYAVISRCERINI